LDSGPLGLLFQKQGIVPADECRAWLKRLLAAGVKVLVPEIVHYELRRELLRLNKTSTVARVLRFCNETPGRYIPITTPAMMLAAELWATARRGGRPTADVHALDVDVILVAQVLSAGHDPSAFVIATTNVTHLSQFAPAEEWTKI
jgi:predicted nucleic acid-binding protein